MKIQSDWNFCPCCGQAVNNKAKPSPIFGRGKPYVTVEKTSPEKFDEVYDEALRLGKNTEIRKRASEFLGELSTAQWGLQTSGAES
jgi:hypothetical protein